MKYTERFFEFPVRIYDRFATKQAEEIEKRDNIPNEGEWAAGQAKIAYQQISTWSDYFDSEQGINGVKERGFEYTLIWTHDEGPFICTWQKDKFEAKLNAYVEKYETWRGDEIEHLMERLNNLSVFPVQKEENSEV